MGRRTSTGMRPFPPLICLGANKFVVQSFFSLIETICPRIGAQPQPKNGKKSTIYVCRSKTSLLHVLLNIVPRSFLLFNTFFTRTGAQIWNSIPYSIKILKRSSFRKRIKELLLNFLRSEDDYVEVSRLIKLFNTLG